MELKDYIGHTVEVTLLNGWDDFNFLLLLDEPTNRTNFLSSEIRTRGLVVNGESEYGQEQIYLRHDTQGVGWKGIGPHHREEGYQYWCLDYDYKKWYENISMVNILTPKKSLMKHYL